MISPGRLIGVGHGKNTSLHLAEHRANFARKALKTEGAPLLVDGERRWITYTDLAYNDSDFDQLGLGFVAAGGLEHVAPLGAGVVRSCRLREIVDFATRWFESTRGNVPPWDPSSVRVQ